MKQHFKYFFTLFLVLSAFLTWRTVLSLENPTLKFYMLDIGQGDAIFIETPSGNQILVDGGPGKKVLSELGDVMPFFDRSIDAVFLTHPDLDHVGGLPEVLKNYDVDLYVDPGQPDTLGEYAEVERLVREKDIKRLVGRRGMKFLLDKDVVVEVLFPEKIADGGNNNKNSLVLRLSYKNEDFLMTGDAERPAEYFLIAKENDLHSEVLKVGHHGSKSSTSDLFLENVRPSYAVISVGAKNTYGHPHEEVLNNLFDVGAKILRTDVNSRVKIMTDGETLEVSSIK